MKNPFARRFQEFHHPGRGRGDDWSEFFRDPAPRADRGTVRYLVLDALADETRHGYEVLRVITEKSGGAYRPSPGVIYPTLQMLEELGQIRLTVREDRKNYALTAEGRAELAAHADEVTEFYESSSDRGFGGSAGDFAQLMQRFRRLIHLVKRTLHRGRLGTAKSRQVRAILDRAIDELEELLEAEP